MALIPLELPAGVYRNGTDLQAMNRWRDSNLVRWIDGTIQPMKGWVERSATAANAQVRGAHSWVDNSDNKQYAAGTYNKLYAYNVSGVQYDITPVGLTAGDISASYNTGYGGGTYGTSQYGTARPETGVISAATTWATDNWGEYLVACSDADGGLYEWQLNTGTPAAAITNAPTSCRSLIVTEERFLMALGASGNPRLVKWSDREDNTTWTAAATNEAGEIELQTAGLIQCAERLRGQTLILTTTDAHVATYQGPPYVYGIERAGTNCGVAGKQSSCATDVGAFWMGDRAFFTYSGGQVIELESTVSDYVFNDLNRDQISKVYAVANGAFGEVWWFYPSALSTENDKYVVFNYKENTWYFGDMARTAGFQNGVYRNPTFFHATDFKPYEHELGYDYAGDTPFLESGPIMLGAGDQVMVASYLYPDEKTQGDVTATFKTRFYPNDTEYTHGPYTLSAPTSVRFTGRQVRMRLEGVTTSDWRVGVMRLDVEAGGFR